MGTKKRQLTLKLYSGLTFKTIIMYKVCLLCCEVEQTIFTLSALLNRQSREHHVQSVSSACSRITFWLVCLEVCLLLRSDLFWQRGNGDECLQ